MGDLDKKQFAFLTNIRPILSWSGIDLKDMANQPSSVPGTYDFYIAPSAGNVETRALIKSQRQGLIQVHTWDEGKGRIVLVHWTRGVTSRQRNPSD